jgi:hypothetical protein
MAESNFTRCIWVSYSGSDHAFVNELTEHFDQDTSSNVRLMTYMRDESEPLLEDKDNGQISTRTKLYLKPGESIQDLVEIIASTLRRMLVISPDYLKSEHCLWELASCFTLDSKVPLCILKDLPSFNEIKKTRRYSFINDQNECTLSYALTWIYNKHILNMPTDFHLNLTSDEEVFKYFTKKINELSNVHYLAANVQTSNEIYEHVESYVQLFKTEHIIENFEKFYKKQYENWELQPYVQHCLEIAENSGNKIPFTIDDLIRQDRVKTTHLIDQLKSQLSNVEYCPLVAKTAIKGFAVLMALRIINQEWAAEMRMSSLSGIRLRLSVSSANKNKQLFDSQLAASVIQQVPLKMEPNKVSFNAPILEGLLELTPLTGSPEQRRIIRTEEKERLLIQLIYLIMKYDQTTAQKFMESDNWQNSLRNRIRSRYLEQNTLTVARLYIEHAKFQIPLDEYWDQLADQLVQVMNHDIDSKEKKIKIGTLIVSTRDEGNLVQFIEDSYLYNSNIDELMECC